MELEGSIASFDISEIFQFITSSHLTGIFNLDLEEKGNVQVFFNSGKIASISINGTMIPLKDILLLRQKLSASSYRQILEDNHIDEKNCTAAQLAKLVIQNGFLTEDELNSYIKMYIEEEVLDLFRYKKGAFKFDNLNTLDDDLFPLLSIEVEPLVIEGNRRNQDWVKFLSEIYSGDLIFSNDAIDKTFFYKVNLSTSEWRVFSLISGKLSVKYLMNIYEGSRYELYRSLYNLLKLGLIHPENQFEFDLYSKRIEKEAFNDLHQKPLHPESVALAKKRTVHEKGFSFKKILSYAGLFSSFEGKKIHFPIEKYNIKTSVGLFIVFNNLFFGSLFETPGFASTEDDYLLYIQLWKEKIVDYPRIDIVKFGTEGLEWQKYERISIFLSEDIETFKDTTEDILQALLSILKDMCQLAAQRIGEDKVRKIYGNHYRILITELERLNLNHLNCIPQKVW